MIYYVKWSHMTWFKSNRIGSCPSKKKPKMIIKCIKNFGISCGQKRSVFLFNSRKSFKASGKSGQKNSNTLNLINNLVVCAWATYNFFSLISSRFPSSLHFSFLFNSSYRYTKLIRLPYSRRSLQNWLEVYHKTKSCFQCKSAQVFFLFKEENKY